MTYALPSTLSLVTIKDGFNISLLVVVDVGKFRLSSTLNSIVWPTMPFQFPL